MRRFISIAICLFLICSLTVAAAPATTDEVYIFSTGKLDRAVTYHGAEKMPSVVSGRNDEKAIELQGTDYLTVDMSAWEAPFTLSMWVNWQDTATNQRIFSLVKQGSENYLSLSPFTDTAVVGKPAASGVTLLTSCFKEQFLRENYYNPTVAGVTDALHTNRWHHIAFTVNEADIAVYIDGVMWKTVTLPFTFAELGADTMYIGSAADGLSGFVGWIQGFTLHTTPLDATAVARMAQGIDAEDTQTPVSVGTYATATLPTAETLQQTKMATLTDAGEAVFADTPTAFWEKPQVATGQTIRGTLTVQNKSNNPANLQLSKIVFPEPHTQAYLYLSEIHVTIMQEHVLLFEGPYTALQAGSLSWRWQQLPNDRQFTYTVTLSRPFSSTAQVVDADVLWQWDAEILPLQQNPLRGIQTNGWLLIVLAVSAVALGFSSYWAIVRRPRRMFTVWDTVAEKVGALFKKNETIADAENEE